MRKTIFAILATTALLSTGMFGTRVEAMTPAPLDVAAPNADLVQQSAVVCGPRGCVHRPTPIRRPLWNQIVYQANGLTGVRRKNELASN